VNTIETAPFFCVCPVYSDIPLHVSARLSRHGVLKYKINLSNILICCERFALNITLICFKKIAIKIELPNARSNYVSELSLPAVNYMRVYMGVQMKCNTLELNRPQHGRPAACVIAQQYSSAIFFSFRFHTSEEKNFTRI
jgi:hypothetical protein